MNRMLELQPVAWTDPPAVPVLDPDRCNSCGKCAEACPTGAIGLAPGAGHKLIPDVKAHLCTYCTVCEAVCPTRAIECPFQIELA